MKISRHKKAHKYLSFFINNFQFHQPFQILVDGTFSHAALENKVNIQDQLPKYFQASVKLLTTPCVILETEKLGPKVFGAMIIIKQYAVHKCGHEKEPVTGSECLRSMLGKENCSRYIIATQDRDLQNIVRNVPGVPLIYLYQQAPVLESPSPASQKRALEYRTSLGMNAGEAERIALLKKASGLALENDKPKLKKKRKKGGPNPLSCKKKKKTNVINSTIESNDKKNKHDNGKVGKRKRIKLPRHVKEILKSETSK